MRIIGEISHPDYKISLFQWNNRYLIKMERGFMEQTFKINQFDLTSDAELQTLIDSEFIHAAMERFDSMEESLFNSMKKLTH